MDKGIKREAVKQYMKYFCGWFIAIGVLLIIWLVILGGRLMGRNMGTSGNKLAPEERVYDLADALTDAEEEELRQYIRQKEQEYKLHAVVVISDMDMEGTGMSWEDAMMNFADDFYDEANYGYDKVHGDGALLLDNRYEGQAGIWLSTCGEVEYAFAMSDIDNLLDRVDEKVEKNPLEAYRIFVDGVCRQMARERMGNTEDFLSGIIGVFFLSTIVAVIYLFVNITHNKARDTTNAFTYMSTTNPEITNKQDEFMRKSVTHVRIDTNTGGGGGGSRSSGGGGGHHVSRGGVSHGGGGRRR